MLCMLCKGNLIEIGMTNREIGFWNINLNHFLNESILVLPMHIFRGNFTMYNEEILLCDAVKMHIIIVLI